MANSGSNLCPANSGHSRPELESCLLRISNDCTQCQLCVKECSFLQTYGDPKTIATEYDPNFEKFQQLPFQCSLCELCTAVCPHDLDPAQLFLEMRREAFGRGKADFPQHRVLRNYEKIGTSKLFTWYALPDGCDTVFFPGCALTGSRPETTLELYRYLQKHLSSLGIVLDCCSKPSHDLGNHVHFNNVFNELKNYLSANGVKTVLVACPNCQKVFNEYGTGLTVESVYQRLDGLPLPETDNIAEKVHLHDPCVSRFYDTTQDAVRSLLKKKGLQLSDSRHSRKTTLCCGAGGGVSCLASERSRNWTTKNIDSADAQRIVSYCASCTHVFAAHSSTGHLLDVVFQPQKILNGESTEAKAPLTYFNRLQVKNKLRRSTTSGTRTRERQIGDRSGIGFPIKRVAVVMFLILIMLAVGKMALI